MDTCWYCQKKPSHPGANVLVTLTKDVGRDVEGIPALYLSTTTYYQKREAIIPRCQDCQTAHAQSSSWFTFLVGTTAVGSGSGVGLGIEALLHITWLSIILGILAGFAMGIFIAAVYYNRNPHLKKVKNIGYLLYYPAVKSLKAQGWKIPAFPRS